MKLKARKHAVILAAVFALVSCDNAENKPAQPTTTAPIKTVFVHTVTPPERDSAKTRVGKVEFDRLPILSFERSGTITSITTEEGSEVKQGETLATQDYEDLSIQRVKLKRELLFANRNLDRLLELQQTLNVDEQQVDNARIERDKISAELSRVALAITRSTLSAPADGIVLERLVEEGQFINRGVVAFRLAQPDSAVIRVGISESELDLISLQMPLTFTLTSKPIQGTVSFIASDHNTDTGMFDIKLMFHSGDQVRQGQVAIVTIPNKNSTRLSVPVDAILDGNGDIAFVYVVDQTDHVTTRQIKIVDIVDNRILVSSGLQQGEQVVVAGREKISEGEKVNPVREDPARP